MPFGPNLISNPSLEVTPSGEWVTLSPCQFGGTFRLQVGAPPASHEGLWIARIVCSKIFLEQCGGMYQDISGLTVGATYRFSGWVSHTFLTATRNRSLTISLGSTQIVVDDDASWNDTSDYRKQTFDHVAISTTERFQFVGSPGTQGSGNTWWGVDDLSVREILNPDFDVDVAVGSGVAASGEGIGLESGVSPIGIKSGVSSP